MSRHFPRSTDNFSGRAVVLSAATLAVAAAGAALMLRGGKSEPHPPDSAPGRTARGRKRFGGYTVTGRTVTIKRPRGELYAFWRDFGNLARFMQNIESVQPTGENRMVWTIAAPGWQTIDVETEIVEDRPHEQISWRSVPGSHIDTEGRVRFRDAPGDRGTLVEAIVAYRPPAGELGRMVAKAFMREPTIQGRHELKRFKMLMETGEVATSSNRRPKA